MIDIKRRILSIFLIFLLLLVIFMLPTMGKMVKKDILNAFADNNPPNPPEISGPSSVIVKRYYKYSFKLTDPDGDYLSKLEIEWGDGTYFEICGCDKFLENGSIVEAEKMWKKIGSYQIRARVADIYNEWSEWAYHPVSVPIDRVSLFNYFISNLKFPSHK